MSVGDLANYVDRVQRVGILGAGRQALETAGYLIEAGLEIVWFFEESPPDYLRAADQYAAPIVNSLERAKDTRDVAAITAVGDPGVRRRLATFWKGWRFAQAISGRAWLAHDVTIGTGSTIAPLVAINRSAVIGDHVLVNVGAIVSHDVVVGDFATLSPGCRIGGACEIGEGAFVGIGATISDHVVVGAHALVAAGAVVVKDVMAGNTVMGVPARPRGGA